MEWEDWAADTLGAGVSILLFKIMPLYSSILEMKLWSKTRHEKLSQNNNKE